MSRIHNRKIFIGRRVDLRMNQTKAEAKLWEYLRNSKLGVKFKRQHSIGPYIADFYSFQAKLIIEVDGDSHFTDLAIEYDRVRTEYFKVFPITVLRFINTQVTLELESVLNEITRHLPHPASPCKGEEECRSAKVQ